MTDCLYTAWADYMHWLGHKTDKMDYALYQTLKVITHGRERQNTFGGVVPWMLKRLGWRYGYYAISGEWRAYSPRMYERLAPTRMARSIVRSVDLGTKVRKITLAPAIYLDLASQHAMFAEQIPRNGSLIAAYQYLKGVKQ